MKNTKKKLAAKAAGFSMKVTSGAVNSACQLFMNQPELPKGAERLRRR